MQETARAAITVMPMAIEMTCWTHGMRPFREQPDALDKRLGSARLGRGGCFAITVEAVNPATGSCGQRVSAIARVSERMQSTASRLLSRGHSKAGRPLFSDGLA